MEQGIDNVATINNYLLVIGNKIEDINKQNLLVVNEYLQIYTGSKAIWIGFDDFNEIPETSIAGIARFSNGTSRKIKDIININEQINQIVYGLKNAIIIINEKYLTDHVLQTIFEAKNKNIDVIGVRSNFNQLKIEKKLIFDIAKHIKEQSKLNEKTLVKRDFLIRIHDTGIMNIGEKSQMQMIVELQKVLVPILSNWGKTDGFAIICCAFMLQIMKQDNDPDLYLYYCLSNQKITGILEEKKNLYLDSLNKNLPAPVKSFIGDLNKFFE